MRISGGVFLIISILVLTGCWGRSELKDVGIVAAVGIDVKDENKFEATTQVVKPGEVKKNKSGAVLVNSTTGFTVFEAVRDLIIKGGKKQIWHHINAYIIGEEAAKTGVRPRIDFLARDHEPRFRMNVFVTKGKAKDLLNMKSNINPIPAAAMQLALEEQESLAKAPKVELHDFIQKLMEPYEDPYLPIIRNGKQNFEIFGTAVFKDDKMVGELNSKETRGMLRVVGEVQGGLQVVQYKPGNDEVPNYLSIEIKKSQSSMRSQVMDNKPKIIIEINETGFLGSITRPLELNDTTIKSIEQSYAQTVKKEVEHAIRKIQKELKANIFGFAGVINRQDKQYWKNHHQHWETIYPSIEVDVRVKTHLPKNGLINNNPGK